MEKLFRRGAISGRYYYNNSEGGPLREIYHFRLCLKSIQSTSKILPPPKIACIYYEIYTIFGTYQLQLIDLLSSETPLALKVFQ
jgi:hypothetical protein